MGSKPVMIPCMLLAATCAFGDSVVRERPAAWSNLVHGGPFKDLFLPMPMRGGMTSDTWGGDNVKPRDVTNGIEAPDWSYWCGFPVKDDDGTFHLYTARWPENEPRGHFGYFDSEIVHATATDPMGPYTYQGWIGPGHNPELYQNAQGEYCIYSTHGRFYSSDSLNGPWKARTYNFDKRGRYAFKNYVNFSFAPRADGSHLAVSRRGYIWASKEGGEDWQEVSAESVYPKVPGIFEDPVLWKDAVQYNMIVNDWKGRIAYHLRSKDGFHWITEPGEAYVPGIARYEDGTVLDWYKFERLRFLQDEHGRPIQAHFAVIDSDKHSDLPNDTHNSKHIIIPIQVAKLIELMNTKAITADTKETRVKIMAEKGFNPKKHIDLDSLRFGASTEVNHGRGSKLLKTEKAGKDLVLVFGGADTGFTTENFAGKLMGKTKKGELLYAWSRLPEVEFSLPKLSSIAPVFEYTDEGLEAYVEVTNFGEVASKPGSVKLLIGKKADQELATGSVRELAPFEKTMVRLVCCKTLPKGSKQAVTVLTQHEGLPAETFFIKSINLPNK
ncbi:hypothetical protein PDESU_06020 [Pontiella desulfatans]|uniref:Uncharacterized protein n=1 Tax=Pontiella desulfatans TaxID=2750659 RepID=A0A6C2UDH1_PONDE|nr:glycoside hydrolase family protein [Pontiella desulfatans]VGO17424.1 hypothetical protein PDESU_06020 [Pontiella desulfatans]